MQLHTLVFRGGRERVVKREREGHRGREINIGVKEMISKKGRERRS